MSDLITTENRLETLLAAAEASEAQYDHETAVAHYTAALALSDLTLEERYKILNGRTWAYIHWGYSKRAAENWYELISLVRELENKTTLAETIIFPGIDNQRIPIPGELVEEALLIAGELNDKRLLAGAKMLKAKSIQFQEWRDANEALQMARDLDDRELVFRFIDRIVSWAMWGPEEDRPPAVELAREARLMAQQSGTLAEQAEAFMISGFHETDLALAISYLRQAFSACQTLNDQNNSDKIANSLGLRLIKMGLFHRGLAYIKLSAVGARLREDEAWYANSLEGIGRAYLGSMQLDEAEQTFREGLSLQSLIEEWRLGHIFGLGRVALARGRMEEAIELYEPVWSASGMDAAHAHADAGLAYLALGNRREALEHSSAALVLMGEKGEYQEHPVQEIWWRRYQVLSAAGEDDAFEALDQAREWMFSTIENLSDEGLRRNYLCRVAINREIALTWTTEATRRGLSLAPFTEHEPPEANLRAQFQRIVQIGARLSAQHDPDSLAEFLVEEFIEMSGAERVLLLLLDEAGNPRIAARQNAGNALELAEPLLGTISHERQALLRNDVETQSEVVQDVEAQDFETQDFASLRQRSLIALPLITQGRLLGVLYGDIRQIFGRFDDADRHLLSMLANQAAAALENAELVSTLEDRVEERTADLQTANEDLAVQINETSRRNMELAIINSVQDGLSSALDMDAIYELVGDQLYDIFDASFVAIQIYDYQNEKIVHEYTKEEGERYKKFIEPLNERAKEFVEKRQLVYCRSLEEYTEYLGGADPMEFHMEGTPLTQSLLFVPLIVNDMMVGYIDLQDTKRDAFDENDIRLVTTLAGSMSVALENARLFNEAKEARADAEAAREAAEAAQDEAERANETKSAFLATMSHELRTPLNAIIGFTRIVKRKATGNLPEKQVNNLGKVLGSAEHLLGLINNVLDIAKIEAGRMDVVETQFQPGALIEQCANTAGPLIKPGVEMLLEITPDLPAIVSDQDKVRQILLNLLSNAAKFTHEGDITVKAHIRALREAPLPQHQPRADMLVIDVVDSGIGMNEEQLGRVFEQFQQADSTTTREYGGTGLGLPISRQLAQLLGGDLTAKSVEGEGSTFTLALPLRTSM